MPRGTNQTVARLRQPSGIVQRRAIIASDVGDTLGMPENDEIPEPNRWSQSVASVRWDQLRPRSFEGRPVDKPVEGEGVYGDCAEEEDRRGKQERIMQAAKDERHGEHRS